MPLTHYLSTFQAEDKSFLEPMTALADYLKLQLTNFNVNLDEDNNVCSVCIFENFLIEKNGDFDLKLSYIGENCVLKGYFAKLAEDSYKFPISALLSDTAVTAKNKGILRNALLSGSIIAILSLKLVQLSTQYKTHLQGSVFDFDQEDILDSDIFDSIFINPVLDFLNLLLSNPSDFEDYQNCNPLHGLINREDEFLDLYLNFSRKIRNTILNPDILDVLGTHPKFQNLCGYKAVKTLNGEETLRKIIFWGKEHRHKAFLFISGKHLHRLNIDDLNTFSTSNLIMTPDERLNALIDHDSAILYDRNSYKSLWNIEEKNLQTILYKIGCFQNYASNKIETQKSVAIFMFTIYWLSRTKLKTVDCEILQILLNGRFVEKFTENEPTALNIDYYFLAMDALYSYAVSQVFDSIADHCLFINSSIQDYLVAQNDNGQSHYLSLSKDTTYVSLERKSKEWHDNMNVERYRSIRFELEAENYEIEGVEFKLITNTDDLITESKEMNHCIASYVEDIFCDEYKAFSVVNIQTQDRATLGYKINHGNYVFDQLSGYGNKRASDSIIDQAMQFIELYPNLKQSV